MPKQPGPGMPSQADEFRDLARELVAHEDGAVFEGKIRKVVQAPKPKSDEKA